MSNTTKHSTNSKKEALENIFQTLSFSFSYLQGRSNNLNTQSTCLEIGSLIQEAETLMFQIAKCKHRGSAKLKRHCIALIQELENHYDFLAVMSENEFLGK